MKALILSVFLFVSGVAVADPATIEVEVIAVKDLGNQGAQFTLRACDKVIKVLITPEELIDSDRGALKLEQAIFKACGL